MPVHEPSPGLARAQRKGLLRSWARRSRQVRQPSPSTLVSPPNSRFSGNLIQHLDPPQYFYYSSEIDSPKDEPHRIESHSNAEPIVLLQNIVPKRTWTVIDSQALGFAGHRFLLHLGPRTDLLRRLRPPHLLDVLLPSLAQLVHLVVPVPAALPPVRGTLHQGAEHLGLAGPAEPAHPGQPGNRSRQCEAVRVRDLPAQQQHGRASVAHGEGGLRLRGRVRGVQLGAVLPRPDVHRGQAHRQPTVRGGTGVVPRRVQPDQHRHRNRRSRLPRSRSSGSPSCSTRRPRPSIISRRSRKSWRSSPRAMPSFRRRSPNGAITRSIRI